MAIAVMAATSVTHRSKRMLCMMGLFFIMLIKSSEIAKLHLFFSQVVANCLDSFV